MDRIKGGGGDVRFDNPILGSIKPALTPTDKKVSKGVGGWIKSLFGKKKDKKTDPNALASRVRLVQDPKKGLGHISDRSTRVTMLVFAAARKDLRGYSKRQLITSRSPPPTTSAIPSPPRAPMPVVAGSATPLPTTSTHADKSELAFKGNSGKIMIQNLSQESIQAIKHYSGLKDLSKDFDLISVRREGVNYIVEYSKKGSREVLTKTFSGEKLSLNFTVDFNRGIIHPLPQQ